MDAEVMDVGTQDVESQAVETQSQESQAQYDPFESKSAKELSQWLKGVRDADPANAKHARTLKDIFGAQFAFKKEFSGGMEEARGIKALVDSVIHTDPERGELRGAEAISALQDSVREIAEIDEKIASGDSSALESFGDEMKSGIVKMTPAILNMARDMDPESYSAAILPHFVQALAQSELLTSYNAMVDVLEEKPPSWLTDAQKTAWAADQQNKVRGLAAGMGNWLNAQAAKAKQIPQPQGNGTGVKKDILSQREADFNKREQEAHWTTNISPKLDEHAAKTFTQLFSPYAKRLNLDVPTSNALKAEFSRRVASTAAKDASYMAQIKRYRSMRNPDAATVVNYTKVQFDKHAKTVMEELVNERYKPFLNGKGRVSPVAATKTVNVSAPGIQMVTVRPKDSDIDHKSRTLDQIHSKIFPLKSGKVVQLQA